MYEITMPTVKATRTAVGFLNAYAEYFSNCPMITNWFNISRSGDDVILTEKQEAGDTTTPVSLRFYINASYYLVVTAYANANSYYTTTFSPTFDSTFKRSLPLLVGENSEGIYICPGPTNADSNESYLASRTGAFLTSGFLFTKMYNIIDNSVGKMIGATANVSSEAWLYYSVNNNAFVTTTIPNNAGSYCGYSFQPLIFDNIWYSKNIYKGIAGHILPNNILKINGNIYIPISSTSYNGYFYECQDGKNVIYRIS